MEKQIKIEYGFESVNGIVKKKYYLHEIPNIKEKCDVWNVLPIAYVRPSTGFKDKKGEEIYKGDKIRYKDSKGYSKIVFEKGTFGFYGISNFIPLFEAKKDYIEVIGNIHENPELLK